MAQFHLLNQTRQSTEYSCGASALRSVLSYWGRDVDEAELMRLLGTNPEVGTFPEEIVFGARTLGFDAELRENLTLDEVQQFTANGNPMIALSQVWRSQRDVSKPANEEWDNGHYIVVLRVDENYVYYQDPYLRMCKAFVPRNLFEEHWHQVMGGDVANKPKLVHLGIYIRGKDPVQRSANKALSLSDLDFRRMGSLNLIVTRFPGMLLPYDLLDELRDVWKSQEVRPSAYVLLTKDKAGRVFGMQGSGLEDDEDLEAINALIAAVTTRSLGGSQSAGARAEAALRAAAAGDFGLSAEDFRGIAEGLPPDNTIIIGLFENVWERKFKAAAAKYGGAVVNQTLVSPEALAQAARRLASS
jgi:predicted double-glycine peptidase